MPGVKQVTRAARPGLTSVHAEAATQQGRLHARLHVGPAQVCQQGHDAHHAGEHCQLPRERRGGRAVRAAAALLVLLLPVLALLALCVAASTSVRL